MLSMIMIMQLLFINPEWVATEYLRKSKECIWDEDRVLESVKCWNLELFIDAEFRGSVSSQELVMEDLVMELGEEN